MMQENSDIFLAGGDALVCLAEPMQISQQHLFVAIHLVRTYLMTNFSPLLPLYTPVHILDDPPSIPPVAYVLNGWPISQPKNK